jgi:hypothetical protein
MLDISILSLITLVTDHYTLFEYSAVQQSHIETTNEHLIEEIKRYP